MMRLIVILALLGFVTVVAAQSTPNPDQSAPHTSMADRTRARKNLPPLATPTATPSQ
jgi:hypothetical protein